MRWIESLEFKDCLDVGCAQPYLMEQILRKRSVALYGCDISEEVIQDNHQRFPWGEFRVIDIARQTWPGDRKFDMVICSEVLEHIDDWHLALINLARMSRRYLVITVPSGKVHKIDRHIGHIRHFEGSDLVDALRRLDLLPKRVKYWGFPFHSLYKHAINSIAYERVYESFAEQTYGFWKKAVSMFLYALFFANDLFSTGSQLLILAERKASNYD